MAFTILIKGFNWRELQIQGDDMLCTIVHEIGHEQGIGASQLCIGEAHDERDLAKRGQAQGQSKRLVGGVSHGHGEV